MIPKPTYRHLLPVSQMCPLTLIEECIFPSKHDAGLYHDHHNTIVCRMHELLQREHQIKHCDQSTYVTNKLRGIVGFWEAPSATLVMVHMILFCLDLPFHDLLSRWPLSDGLTSFVLLQANTTYGGCDKGCIHPKYV